MNVSIIQRIIVAVFLALLTLFGALAGPNDPVPFGNDTTDTVWIGGASGIVNATGFVYGQRGLSGNLTWTDLYGYPAACPAGSFVTTIGDAIICTESTGVNATTQYIQNLSVNAIFFNTSYTPSSHVPGQLHWDVDDGTLNVDTDHAGVELQLGQEMYVKVVNKQSFNITNGQVVYISGVQGNRPTINLSNASIEETTYIIGVATENIEINAEGYITTFGLVRGVNTAAFSAGDQVYISSIAGNFTNVRPVAPNHGIKVGTVISSHATQGILLVQIQNGFETYELHDVNATKATSDGDILVWDNSGQLFQVKNLNTLTVNDSTARVVQNGLLIDPTGFQNNTATVLRFDATTRNFNITPLSGSTFDFYVSGTKCTRSAENVVIPNVIGQYYLYYNSCNAMINTTAPWDFKGIAQVATIYWDGTKGIVGDERHGISMDWATHEFIHDTIGTRYETGLTGTFNNTAFTMSTGAIDDEDLEFNFAANANMNVLYRAGTNWTWLTNQTQYFYKNATNMYYDNGGTLAAVTSNSYMAVWVFATNDVYSPIMAIIGQRQDGTLALARANNLYESLSLGTLPVDEMKLLYRVIIRNDVTPYEEVQDLRTVSNLPSGTYVATDHGALTGLTDQDHPASAIYTSTSNFNNILSTTDTDVQAALDTIDNNAAKAGNTGEVLSYWNNITDRPQIPAGDGIYLYNSSGVMYWNTTKAESQLTSNSSKMAADLTCTDCIGTTEIADSYVLNTGDTVTGDLITTNLYGTTTSPFTILGKYQIIGHPESGNFVPIPYVHNDIGYLPLVGGNVEIYVNGTNQSLSEATRISMFDGKSAGYSTVPGTDRYTFVVYLQQTWTWGSLFGWSSVESFRGTNFTISARNASNNEWTVIKTETNYATGQYVYPVGIFSGQGLNAVMINFTGYASASIFRVSEIFLMNYAGNMGYGYWGSRGNPIFYGSSIFNEGGGDYDMRVEGDTDTNLLYVDASQDKVGIGTSGPTQKLSVSGNISTTASFIGDMSWTNLSSYPAACSAGQFITTLGDTITCSAAVTSESDPQVGLVTHSSWCVGNGTGVNCNATAPVDTDTDTSIGVDNVYIYNNSNIATFNTTKAASSLTSNYSTYAGYATSAGNPFDQTLNKTSAVNFSSMFIRASGTTLTEIDGYGDIYLTGYFIPPAQKSVPYIELRLNNGTSDINSYSIFIDGNDAAPSGAGNFRISDITKSLNYITLKNSSMGLPYVGINNTSPEAVLDVNGNISADDIVIAGSRACTAANGLCTGAEVDPQVGLTTFNSWCVGNGTGINCNASTPAGATDTSIGVDDIFIYNNSNVATWNTTKGSATYVTVGADKLVTIAGENVTSGTVADARIASTITRDSEVPSLETDPQVGLTTFNSWCVGNGTALNCNATAPVDTDTVDHNLNNDQIWIYNTSTAQTFNSTYAATQFHVKTAAFLTGTDNIWVYNNSGTVTYNSTYGATQYHTKATPFYGSVDNVYLYNNSGVITWNTTKGSATYLTSYTETDPQVGLTTFNSWCVGNGTALNCNATAPVDTDTVDHNLNNDNIWIYNTSTAQTFNSTYAATQFHVKTSAFLTGTDNIWVYNNSGAVTFNSTYGATQYHTKATAFITGVNTLWMYNSSGSATWNVTKAEAELTSNSSKYAATAGSATTATTASNLAAGSYNYQSGSVTLNANYSVNSGTTANLVATTSVVADAEVDNDITIDSTKEINTTIMYRTCDSGKTTCWKTYVDAGGNLVTVKV